MRGRRPPPGINEEIARMLAEGASQASICRTLHVGLKRIRAIKAGDMSFGEDAPVEVNADDEGERAQAADLFDRETVTVGAEYLRALEALLFMTEQCRTLRAALEAA